MIYYLKTILVYKSLSQPILEIITQSSKSLFSADMDLLHKVNISDFDKLAGAKKWIKLCWAYLWPISMNQKLPEIISGLCWIKSYSWTYFTHFSVKQFIVIWEILQNRKNAWTSKFDKFVFYLSLSKNIS